MGLTTFSSGVSAWVAEAKERLNAVHRQSAQETIEFMQEPVAQGGHMPVDTGFLRASLVTTLHEPNLVLRDNPGDAHHTYDAAATVTVISTATYHDRIRAAYTAKYAQYVNDGARGRPPRQFVNLAAQRFPQIVASVCARAEARAR